MRFISRFFRKLIHIYPNITEVIEQAPILATTLATLHAVGAKLLARHAMRVSLITASDVVVLETCKIIRYIYSRSSLNLNVGTRGIRIKLVKLKKILKLKFL